jgi:hypothetical protein
MNLYKLPILPTIGNDQSWQPFLPYNCSLPGQRTTLQHWTPRSDLLPPSIMLSAPWMASRIWWMLLRLIQQAVNKLSSSRTNLVHPVLAFRDKHTHNHTISSNNMVKFEHSLPPPQYEPPAEHSQYWTPPPNIGLPTWFLFSLARTDPIQGKGVWSSAYAWVVRNHSFELAAAVCHHESLSP